MEDIGREIIHLKITNDDKERIISHKRLIEILKIHDMKNKVRSLFFQKDEYTANYKIYF